MSFFVVHPTTKAVAFAPHRSSGGRVAAPASPEVESRWTAVVTRDLAATFFYGVVSTGIYCRPSCSSKRPLRKNVRFFETAAIAELAGFRACLRCRPRELHTRVAKDEALPVIAMCQRLEESFAEPTLSELARGVGLSAPHAHRLFVRATGLTPKRFRDAVVRRRVQDTLQTAATVTQAIYGAGIGSQARFYERLAPLLGMPVQQYRQGAPKTTIRFSIGRCSLGSVLVAMTHRGVCAVLLGDEPEGLVQDLERRFPRADLVRPRRRQDDFDRVVSSVIEAVEGRPGKAMGALPLDIRGTVFQERVWRALLEIPLGKTATYTQIARAIGRPAAVRAVAHACAENSLAVLVPCHRVKRSDGSLAGYRWGLERKRELLEREALAGGEEQEGLLLRTAEARNGRTR